MCRVLPPHRPTIWSPLPPLVAPAPEQQRIARSCFTDDSRGRMKPWIQHQPKELSAPTLLLATGRGGSVRYKLDCDAICESYLASCSEIQIIPYFQAGSVLSLHGFLMFCCSRSKRGKDPKAKVPHLQLSLFVMADFVYLVCAKKDISWPCFIFSVGFNTLFGT